jgi:bifunctional DNase/RNase
VKRDIPLCDEHGPPAVLNFRSDAERSREHVNPLEGAICFELEAVLFVNEPWTQQICLRELGATRQLRIPIGTFEAWTLYHVVNKTPCPTPLTPYSTKAAIEALGGEVKYALLYECEPDADVFYARVILEQSRRAIPIEMRFSHALGLVLACEAPLYVSKNVLAAQA